MGSSRSKPRKGHKKPQHLPKVGTPANRAWEHDTRKQLVFGSGLRMLVIVLVLVIAVVGLLLLTL